MAAIWSAQRQVRPPLGDGLTGLAVWRRASWLGHHDHAPGASPTPQMAADVGREERSEHRLEVGCTGLRSAVILD